MESMPRKARQREQTEQEELKGAAAGSTDGKEKREVEAGHEDAMRNEEEWRNIVVKNKLAAAQEGEAPLVLLDRSAEEMASCEDLATALDCWFGRVEPAVGLRQRLATRYSKPGEKPGVLAANLRYVAWRGYPNFLPAAQEDLVMEAFIRGLTPAALRQQLQVTLNNTFKQAESLPVAQQCDPVQVSLLPA
ncbi:UNVERIFIED_CONTAM: hypothetical protein FKN15_029733 [Acipenser sinensis]